MRRRRDEENRDKVLDVNASMQGTLAFKDPVNLRINGKFEGKLETCGNLTIGEQAIVNADIKGEDITVGGRVNGDIEATKRIRLVSPACVVGSITTPSLHIDEGAVLEGHCNMLTLDNASKKGSARLTVDQVAEYLEVDGDVVSEWADTGKLPAIKDSSGWMFDRAKIEDWLANEKIK